MGDAARTGLARTSLRHGAWVLLLLFLAACAEQHSIPTAPATTASSTAATDDAQQLAAIPPEPLMSPYEATPAERNCLALTVYYEARAESLEGQQAVAAVVLNRARDGKFPKNLCAVVHEGGGQRDRCQFSWYCDGRSDKPRDGGAWRQAVAVADAAIDGEITDPTDGALYFHSTGVKPKWRKKLTKTAAIDNHIFYR